MPKHLAPDSSGNIPVPETFVDSSGNSLIGTSRIELSTRDPLHTDDSSAEFKQADRWINTSTGVEYILLDATIGSADWKTINKKGVYQNLEIDYTDSGTDRNLKAPRDPAAYTSAYNLNIIPAWAAPGDFSMYIGQYQYWSGEGGSELTSSAINGLAGGTFGQVKFTTYGQGNWTGFLPASFNGLRRLYIAEYEDQDQEGGFIEYYYHNSAWTTAFSGNTSEVIVAQSGSVYKGSISTPTLVVAWDGTVGEAGGGLPNTEASLYPVFDNENSLYSKSNYHSVDRNYYGAYANPLQGKLDDPSATYNTTKQICPISGTGTTSFFIGSRQWDLPAGTTTSGAYTGQGGTGNGSAKFSDTGTWNSFLSEYFNGLRRIYLPKLADDDNLGGVFDFYYHADAWSNAFNGKSDEVHISRDGSVWKGANIGNLQYLVVTSKGIVGPAGFGAYYATAAHEASTSNPHSVTAAQIGVEAGADVTDATNVAAAGAVMENTNNDGQIVSTETAVSSSSNSITLNANLGNAFRTTLTENITDFNITNPLDAGSYVLVVTQATGTHYNITWATGETVKWEGGVPYSATQTDGAIDLVSLYRSNGFWIGTFIKDFQ